MGLGLRRQRDRNGLRLSQKLAVVGKRAAVSRLLPEQTGESIMIVDVPVKELSHDSSFLIQKVSRIESHLSLIYSTSNPSTDQFNLISL